MAFPLPTFGLGLFMSWLWLFFLNGPILFNSPLAGSHWPETIFRYFLFTHSCGFLAVAAFASRMGPIVYNKPLLMLGSALLCFGTILTGTTSPTNAIAILSGTTAAALGGAILSTAWGEAFSVSSVRTNALSFGGAVLIGTTLFYVTQFLSYTTALIMLSILSLSSFSLSYMYRYAIAKTFTPQKFTCPLPREFIQIVLLLYVVGGAMHKLIYAVPSSASLNAFWLTNVVYCFTCLGAGCAVFFYPALDLRLLYRPVLPMLGAGFILYPFLSGPLSIIPFALFQIGFGLADLYTWLFVIYLASHQSLPGHTVGWGMFFLLLFILLGNLLSTAIVTLMPWTDKVADAVSLIGAVIMLIASALLPSDRRTFADVPMTTGHEAPETAGEEAKILPPSPQSTVYLTEREKEIVSLLRKGRNNPVIRVELTISDNTLKTHLRNIYRKFSVGNRQELLSVLEREDTSRCK